MQQTLEEQFRQRLTTTDFSDPQFATGTVDAILTSAGECGVSDVHLLPAENHLAMSWRIDGVLQPVMEFPREVAANIVARLKVVSDLLTYRTDIPQEGRIRNGDSDIEMRVSTFPTLFGEKAVVRLFVGSGSYRFLDDLGLPDEMGESLKQLLLESGGVLLITGPAGSGKTTTIYACLRELVNKFGVEKSLVTLEDPIEAVVPGVAQSQIKSSSGFDYPIGLRSLMRQDPEIIMVGEIRDRQTAETVFQASLTGHLVLTTFHAGSAAGAISRLSDMGIEPYLLRSGILAIVSQRLVRRLCECAAVSDLPEARMGLEVDRASAPIGCERCGGTGYRGRMVLAEMLLPDLKEMGRAILSRSDAVEIEELAATAGMVTRWQRGCHAVSAGLTSAAEIRRVLGFR